MSSKVLIPPSSTPRPRGKRRGVDEMAGGAAADCTAVCCCPCAVLNVVVLVVYSLPAGLFRKAVHRRRRRLTRNGAKIKKTDVAFMQSQRSSVVDNDFRVDSLPLDERFKKDLSAEEKLKEVALEKEMWARFAGTGFWRSDSQPQPI